jgi:hypothetical protein
VEVQQNEGYFMIPLQARIIERMHTLEEFAQAYEGLGDALLKHVALAYTQENQPQITVVLECMSALVDYEWVNLEIRFSGVQEFNIASKKQYTVVIVESFAAN